MNENAKTTVFVAAAVVAAAVLAGLHGMRQSWLPDVKPEDMVGKQLFDDFEPLTVANLQIVKYDEDTGTANHFQVSQVNNRWSIPSHSNYPTDAKDQLADAAASVLGLKVLAVESDNPGDHALYGVLDPTSKTLKAGSIGVGTRVTMKDKSDKTLIDLIIGKKVEGASDKELHYVCRAGQDPVYTMLVKTDKLSTKFEDWIEEDLLKLNSWDIRRVEIRDHSVDEAKRSLVQRGEMTLAYDDAGDPKWKMLEDRAFREGDWVPVQMADDEELDTGKLDDLKSALDDLKIVDVQRKPAGLSGDLKAEADFANNNEALLSLMEKGFYVAEVEDRIELVSNEGEIRCTMKDGVEYVLRFGAIDTESNANNGETEQEGDDAGGFNPNRYIFVMAEFNPDILAKPELEPLPEAEEKPSDQQDPNAENGASSPENQDGGTEANADEKKDGGAGDNERERIQKENQRKQDEYDQKVADGKKRVKELNDRFADWYYVISDDVYRKIHLGRDQIVKKKEKKDEPGDGKDGTSDGSGGPDAAGLGFGQPGMDEQPSDNSAAGALHQFERLKQEGPGGEGGP